MRKNKQEVWLKVYNFRICIQQDIVQVQGLSRVELNCLEKFGALKEWIVVNRK